MGHKNLITTDQTKDYPPFLKKIKGKVSRNEEHPILIEMKNKGAEKELNKLISSSEIVSIVDNYAEQYAELLLSKNAHLYQANYNVQVASIKDLIKDHYKGKSGWQTGTWVYFPWTGTLNHILGEHDFEELRTIRNRDLITKEEQKKLYDFDVVCFGMSVGSASAIALGISGISRRIKLVDGAVISGSNLNRIATGVGSVGKNKAIVTAQQIYEMNPYSEVMTFGKADKDNIGDIFDKPWPVKLVIDEIDDIEMKVKIRIEARKRRIPVLMATELGDTVMIDIERYDLEDNRNIFHGLVPGIEELLERKLENQREWMKNAVKIIDPQNMPVKMMQSLMKIGTTIVTHPQLGSTVMMTGGAIAFASKNIALDSDIRSGRYVISLENKMLATNKRKSKRDHKKHTKIINKAINSM